MKTIIFLTALCFPLGVAGQGNLSDEMRSRFPDESAVFLNRSMTITVLPDGDSLKCYTDISEDLLHLKSQTEGYTRRKVYGSSFVSINNLRAKTLVWEKNRYREAPVTEWVKNTDSEDHVFYDDSYFYSCNYPSVAAGNRTILQYREIQKEVRFLSGYLFTTYAPQARSTFIIKTTKDVDLAFMVFNDPTNRITFRRTEKGNSVTLEWTAENLPAIVIEENSPAVRYYEPHVSFFVKSYKVNGKTVDVLPDVKALHSWYRGFITGIDESPSAALVGIVSIVKAQSKSELDLVRNIFNWVQRNIEYIAFEDGMRGFVPHSPSFTCEKRYGDCKDMAALLVGMLRAAGVTAYSTWIGTRDIPYRYSDLPTPIVDNHMIATYKSSEGKYYFLDATSKYDPFGFPSAMIQGKEALISMGPDQFEIREVPVISPVDNLITDSLRITLIDNAISGQGRLSLHGHSKGSIGNDIEKIEEKRIRESISRIVNKGNNKFFLDKYVINNQLVDTKPTEVDYEFRLADYCQAVGEELYLNLNLSKDNYNRFINEDTRKTPHEFDFKYIKKEFIEFTVPEGYDVEYLPPDESFNGSLIGYTVRYERTSNMIRYRKHYYVNYLLLQPSQFKTWNEEVGKISNAYKETIILKRKK
jgi:hypothetical protein